MKSDLILILEIRWHETDIAERKKLSYQVISNLEEQRKKLESSINTIKFNDYNPAGMTQIRTKLETELVKVEMGKGEEAIAAFRDIEMLEQEKRKVIEEIRGVYTTKLFS